MKLNYWLIIGAMLSTSLLAQQATNSPPAAPATPAPTLAPAPAETNAPAAKPAKKKSAKKKTEKKSEKQAAKKAEKAEKTAVAKKPAAKKPEPMAELKTTPLVAGPAIVDATHVNVRGQPKLKSEVVAHLNKGDKVTVLEEIVKNESGPEEPSAWAKIALPPGGHAWVNTMFIDTNTFTVKPKKLNLRSGPGENYSVIGLVEKGAAVKQLKTKGDWTEVEPPADAYAFVAAQYLSQEAPAVAAVATPPVIPTPTPTPAAPVTPTQPPPAPPEPAPAATTVATAPTVAPPPTEAPPLPATIIEPPKPPPTQTPPPFVLPLPATVVEPAIPEEPPPPRIVSREGIVRGMTSIQAPSRFVLISPENRKNIDYLYTTSTNLDLRRYKGLRIIVTGEEGLDDRWGNTPVLNIQKIHKVGE